MSIKACIGGLLVGTAVGMAVATVFPVQIPQRDIRRVRRYIKNML